MTKITEKGIYEGRVTDIKHNVRAKGSKHIHLITMTLPDGSAYTAEECEDDPKSRFVLGINNVFELTNPGKPGSLDWIRWKGAQPAIGQPSINGTSHDEPKQPAPKQSTFNRDDYFAAQTAMTCATQIGLKYEWTTEQIVNTAYMIAGNIKLIAKNISEEL